MSSTTDPSTATNSSSNPWTRILGEWLPLVVDIIINIANNSRTFAVLAGGCGAALWYSVIQAT